LAEAWGVIFFGDGAGFLATVAADDFDGAAFLTRTAFFAVAFGAIAF
jgi:hypothetical protein